MIAGWCKHKRQIAIFLGFHSLFIPYNMLIELKSIVLLEYFVSAEILLFWLIAGISHLKNVDSLDEFLLAP